MLRSLSIRDVVLIDRLDLELVDGLSVLTGETGAGKSILLDALGLALGMRGDSGLVRHGADKSGVTARFEVAPDHPIFSLLADQELEIEDADVVLRRSLNRDGRSRAWINDQPVSVGLMRQAGALLVEIQGQFDQHGLLDSTTHRATLDAHGDLRAKSLACRDAHADWATARKKLKDAQKRIETARADEEWLRHAVEELDKLGPQPGEEEQLATERQSLMHGEKLRDALSGAETELNRGKGAETALRSAQRHLEREAQKAEGRFDPILSALDRAAIELEEAITLLNRVSTELDLDPRHQEQLEERLFSLRAMARKHNTSVDGLVPLLEDLHRQLTALEHGERDLSALSAEEKEAKAAYVSAAETLSSARRDAGAELDAAINQELAPLKMERARFATDIARLDERDWGPDGMDRVQFMVATNPGTPPGPLDKIASGGELSRFLLALKLVLAKVSPIGTLVFDEIDAGVGGATAAAIGARLHRLAGETQLLAITHSPQVAARGDAHLNIKKGLVEEATVTRVAPLVGQERRDEIARMLAGHHITDQARAAADSLLDGPADPS